MSAAFISSVLVANRGEIARRVFRTARAMGLVCVAVYTDADTDALSVQDADIAIRLEHGYLDQGAVVAAALDAGADAIHPGYGFLAENSEFAQSVQRAGLTWIGPPPSAIAAMGDKLTAKELAASAQVPILPSTPDPGAAAEIGYPLLVKAAAGGGGKGMRLVEAEVELDDAIDAAQREAEAGFGDNRVFLERYVQRARHVEIQILGDSHDNLVHLGERECSIQRRHQKIIEESPSPFVDDELRTTMAAAALRMAEAMGYESAGTVEFLIDDDTGEFFFLEVNTRLQVEHPVTEGVTGIDLVREQFRIASGEQLGYVQNDVTFSGHAVEARLYAEDPSADFLPATGTLSAFSPAETSPARWDSGVAAGSVVGIEYDPMLAKVITHAPTRSDAVNQLARALETLHIGGVTTNRDFLVATLRSAQFLDGDTTTDFISRIEPARQRQLSQDRLEYTTVAAALWLQGHNRHEAGLLTEMPSGFRNARLPPQEVDLAIGEYTETVYYRATRSGTFALGADGNRGEARLHAWTPAEVDVEWHGMRTIHRVTMTDGRLWLTGIDGTAEIEVVPRFRPPGTEIPSGALVAPMPGVVLDVRSAPGDSVAKGDTLLILEAMKMEHHMYAPADGVITEVRVVAGDQVTNGQLLIVFDDGSSTASSEGSGVDGAHDE